MTVKEIAAAVGKSDDSVQHWIKKIVDQPQNTGVQPHFAVVESIRLKAGSKDPHHPADYTPEEALLIIEAGLGKDAAGIFRANLSMAAELAQIKAGLVVRNTPPDIDPWKGLSTARLHELRMRIHELRRDLEEERISVREFRRLALNLDTPDTPENPVRGALVFKTHDDFTEYAETHKKANPTVYSFAKTALKITGNPADFVMIRDLYRLYQENTNTWEAVSRQKFVRRIKELYPGLEYKQKKVDGKPELAFFGCVLGGKGGVSDSHP